MSADSSPLDPPAPAPERQALPAAPDWPAAPAAAPEWREPPAAEPVRETRPPLPEVLHREAGRAAAARFLESTSRSPTKPVGQRSTPGGAASGGERRGREPLPGERIQITFEPPSGVARQSPGTPSGAAESDPLPEVLQREAVPPLPSPSPAEGKIDIIVDRMFGLGTGSPAAPPSGTGERRTIPVADAGVTNRSRRQHRPPFADKQFSASPQVSPETPRSPEMALDAALDAAFDLPPDTPPRRAFDALSELPAEPTARETGFPPEPKAVAELTTMKPSEEVHPAPPAPEMASAESPDPDVLPPGEEMSAWFSAFNELDADAQESEASPDSATDLAMPGLPAPEPLAEPGPSPRGFRELPARGRSPWSCPRWRAPSRRLRSPGMTRPPISPGCAPNPRPPAIRPRTSSRRRCRRRAVDRSGAPSALPGLTRSELRPSSRPVPRRVPSRGSRRRRRCRRFPSAPRFRRILT